MNGDPFYKPDIKPYISYWTKEGMTEDERDRDSLSCRSGGITGGGGIYRPDFDAAHLPGETENATYDRLNLDWERCMLRAGYNFTGNCSSDWAKTRPKCGSHDNNKLGL